MKNFSRIFRFFACVVLCAAPFQGVWAGQTLLFFKKDDQVTVLESAGEENIGGFLKVTGSDGKVSAWQEQFFLVKFVVPSESEELADPAALEKLMADMEAFMAKEPRGEERLKPLVERWKGRLNWKKAEAEAGQKKQNEEQFSQFFLEEYKEEGTYSLDLLESKAKEHEAVSGLFPERKEKIEAYWKPWGDELKNRQAGLVRFEGQWRSPAAIQEIQEGRLRGARTDFFEKEFSFAAEQEALSSKSVYIAGAVLAASALLFAILFLSGLGGLIRQPGLATWGSLLVGGGGLAAYGLGAWMLMDAMKNPSSGAGGKTAGGESELETVIYAIHRPENSGSATMPESIKVEDPTMNALLEKYLTLKPAPAGSEHAVLRKGLKVKLEPGQVVILDELVWIGKNLPVRYELQYEESQQGLQFGELTGSVGSLPIPAKLLRHLWGQVNPIMEEMVARSRLLESYYVKKMGEGSVELVAKRTGAKQAAR